VTVIEITDASIGEVVAGELVARQRVSSDP
jgi:hypothetical protein